MACRRALAQIGLQDLASGGVLEPADRLFLDLPDPLPGQVKGFPDLL